MKMVNGYNVLFLTAVLFASTAFAQVGVKPNILREVKFEKTRVAKLEQAIIAAAGINKEEDTETRYYFNLVDLDGDKKPEVLVYVFGGYFCGTGGCDAFLFKKVKENYRLVSHFQPVRNPIVVSEKKTNGWKDLIFFNSGGGINPGYYSVCRYGGTAYPGNPTVEEDAPVLNRSVKGTSYLVDSGDLRSGLKFLFKK